MIDFSSNPFGLSNISVSRLEGLRFTDDSERLKADILEMAKQRSAHCVEFADYMLIKAKKSRAVKFMFTPSVFSCIARTCNRLNDEEILSFYLDAYQLVTPTLSDFRAFSSWSTQAIDICFRNHMKPDAVNEITTKMMALKRVPVAFIIEKYLKGKPIGLQEYITKSTFIYPNSSKEVSIPGVVDNQDLYDTLIKALYRICNQLRRICRHQMQREYMELSWEAINAQEGTSFTPCFITWLKWAAINAQFLGTRERNDGYPSWCFAPFSMEVCFGGEKRLGLDSLYDKICDLMGRDREKKIKIPLQPYYEDEEYKAEFHHACLRVVTSMNVGIRVVKSSDSIEIPSGKGIEEFRLIRKV